MNPRSGKGALGRCFQQKEQTAATSLHSCVSSHTPFDVAGAYKVKEDTLRLSSGSQVT